MTTDLNDYADVLRRRVTPAGSDLFSNVTDEEMGQRIQDGFWDARLDGFLVGFTADDEGIVTPELPRDLIALAVMYAAITMLQIQVYNLNTRFAVKAGPVEFETENSASVLKTMLDQIFAQRQRLLEELDEVLGETPVYITDAAAARSASPSAYYAINGVPMFVGLWDWMTDGW